MSVTHMHVLVPCGPPQAAALEARKKEIAEAKRKEQESAAARKEHGIKERQMAKQRANEEKAARLRKFQEEKLREQRAKKQKQEAKQQAAKRLEAEDDSGYTNAWYCDVALEGCLRPCEHPDYAPGCRYTCGDEYAACEVCFENHLTAEQQEQLECVEPPPSLLLVD